MEKNLKAMLWGDTKFTKEMFEFIYILIQSEDI